MSDGPVPVRTASRAVATTAGSAYLVPTRVRLADGREVDAEEGLVFVPERHGTTGGRVLGVYVLRLHGATRTAAPVYALPGGPGSSFGREELASGALDHLVEWVLPHGDLVLMNQRAAPRVPLQPVLAWPRRAAQPLDRPLSFDAEARAGAATVRDGLRRLRDDGLEPAAYDIRALVADLDAVRRAFGDDRLRLYGRSFGSQWAFAYLREHPHAVDRALLVGVEPLDHAYDDPAALWRALELAAKRAQRAFDGSERLPPEGLLPALQRAVERLDAEPRSIVIADPGSGREVRVTIGGDDLRRRLFNPVPTLSLRDNLRVWPRFAVDVANGDLRLVARAALATRATQPPEPATLLLVDNSLGISAARDARLRAAPEARLTGDVNALYRATRELTPTATVDDEYRAPVRSDVPIVLLQGDLDYSTPHANAREAQAALARSRLVTVVDGTHAADRELVRSADPVNARLREFFAAPSASAAAAVLRSLPDAVSLPPLRYLPLDGPSLYELVSGGALESTLERTR